MMPEWSVTERGRVLVGPLPGSDEHIDPWKILWFTDFGDEALDDLRAKLTEREALRSLVRRLWNAQHVSAWDYDRASVEEFTTGLWFGRTRAQEALSEGEAAALLGALDWRETG